MGPLDPIRLLLEGPIDVQSASFEALARAHAERSDEVSAEFVRRLSRLIYQAADYRAQSASPSPARKTAQELHGDVFIEFAPEFSSGSPRSLMRRFAEAIRRILGEDAFTHIAYFYYIQLPIYMIRDRQQRELMAAAYGDGVGIATVDRLSIRFGLPRERTVALLKDGHKALEVVCKTEFGPGVLDDETEGYLS